MSQSDLTFLVSQYIVANKPDQIHYQKFIDDLTNVNRAYDQGMQLNKKLSVGINTAATSGADRLSVVCEAIIKKLYILGI